MVHRVTISKSLSPKRASPRLVSTPCLFTGRGKGFFSKPVAVTLVVLIAAGVGHRILSARIETALDRVLQLKKPLSTMPLIIGSWEGRDVPVDENTLRIAGDDDYVNRLYRHIETGRGVSLYIGYIGRPRMWLGHRPDRCYLAHGYDCLSQDSMELLLPDGTKIPCFVYEFGSPTLGKPHELVVATYLVNGEFLPSLDRVNEINSRYPNFSGDRPAYIARIQASAIATGDRREHVQELLDFTAEILGDVQAILPQSR